MFTDSKSKNYIVKPINSENQNVNKDKTEEIYFCKSYVLTAWIHIAIFTDVYKTIFEILLFK